MSDRSYRRAQSIAWRLTSDSRILALTFRLSSQISHISPYVSKSYTPKPSSSLEKGKNGPLVTLGKLMCLVGLKTVEADASRVSAQGGNTAEADASHVSAGQEHCCRCFVSFCSFKLGHVKTLVQPGPASYFVKL